MVLYTTVDLHTTFIVSLTQRTIKKADFIVEYLREYEGICKKAFNLGSGAQMELFDEKIRRSKIS
jgi:hypothetical protein